MTLATATLQPVILMATLTTATRITTTAPTMAMTTGLSLTTTSTATQARITTLTGITAAHTRSILHTDITENEKARSFFACRNSMP